MSDMQVEIDEDDVFPSFCFHNEDATGKEDFSIEIKKAIGKEIAGIEIKDDARDGSYLMIRFADRTFLKIWDDEQYCCEDRYLYCPDSLHSMLCEVFIGAEVKHFKTDVDIPKYNESDIADEALLEIRTSNDTYSIMNYNEHNGYYGGFGIRAQFIEEKSDE